MTANPQNPLLLLAEYLEASRATGPALAALTPEERHRRYASRDRDEEDGYDRAIERYVLAQGAVRQLDPAQVRALAALDERMRAALEWYGDEGRWTPGYADDGLSEIEHDRGETARAALAGEGKP